VLGSDVALWELRFKRYQGINSKTGEFRARGRLCRRSAAIKARQALLTRWTGRDGKVWGTTLWRRREDTARFGLSSKSTDDEGAAASNAH
jgi:hypothetical protein